MTSDREDGTCISYVDRYFYSHAFLCPRNVIRTSLNNTLRLSPSETTLILAWL